MVPEYWIRATSALSERDPALRQVIRQCSGAQLRRRARPFVTLARSIVGQQISVRAADAVWNRLSRELIVVSPTAVLQLGGAALSGCGLSARKAEYLLDLASHFEAGLVHPRRWNRMSDEEVIAELIQIRGIGRWTAEMFLIFNLLRPDVLPVDDIGLQRAVGLHYFEGEHPTRGQLLQVAERWRPWRTVATWHLWRTLDPLPVEY